MNIQQLVKEIVEKEGPKLALQWGKELREDREELKRRKAKKQADSSKSHFAHH